MLGFVALYLLASIGIGLYAARRVHSTADYAVAGRALPLPMVIATTFATWFGSETVLGIPARFAEGGLRETVEDPWGAGLCLILVGLFFARRLYRLSLLTIGDYYRDRYGRAVEVFCSAVSVLSYLGWVAAQITALGVVFHALSDGQISQLAGALIGMGVVLFYTLLGGMWSVALTDFVQMILIVLGLTVIAVIAAGQAGGAGRVLDHVVEHELHHFLPAGDFKSIAFFIGAGVTIMLGSIPQQDVYQRVMSAKNESIAATGPVIGGAAYLLFSLVPMFIVASSLVVMPEEAASRLEQDPQQLLPTFVRTQMPTVMQVLFFGALLSAIMSTASATILAPSTIFVENILKNFAPRMSDQQELRLMRLTVLGFSGCVLAYAMWMHGTSIYDLVSSSYEAPVVGAFVPLACGLYWKRASNAGAILSIACGVLTWLLFMFTPLGEAFPRQLAGLIMAGVGMWVGSLVLPSRESPRGEPTDTSSSKI
ncbi:MAG: sodium:solute symporter family protein [Planctomycetales bacterium]|nr:sodium:solute symporter family protein [Planctomycetales bacterium]